MARIPEPEIERLESEVSVEHLVQASGTLPKKSGKDWLGRCPFHEDDTASLTSGSDLGSGLWFQFPSLAEIAHGAPCSVRPTSCCPFPRSASGVLLLASSLSITSRAVTMAMP